MVEQNGHNQSKLNVDDIARPKAVIHPALDWVNGQLVVGVVFADGRRAALTSRDGLVEIDQIGPVCERDGNFESQVTPEMAKEFIAYLGTNPSKCPREEFQALQVELADYFSRFVIFPEKHWSRTMAAWTIGTYLFPIFQAYPYLWLTSPEPGCGKSLLGQMLANLSFNGEFMASPTEANMFHLPEQNRGVQVWDEVEFANQVEKSRFQSVKAILLSGYRNGAVVPRQVGTHWDKPVKYHVFCPRVLIGLSQLPETARQRSIMLGLRKRSQVQKAELYRGHDQTKEEVRLKEKCVLTALKCAADVNQFYNDEALRKSLETLLGRAGREVDDVWLPLFAIASASSADTTPDSNLVEAAKQSAKDRDIPNIATASQRTASVPSARNQVERPPNEALVTALHLLAWSVPFEPTKLAKEVSDRIEMKVSAQWLSKHLRRLGILAKRKKGRRVFQVSRGELNQAKGKLGICPSAPKPGQEGQEGQQQRKNAEELEKFLGIHS
jgi:hypothetical protein